MAESKHTSISRAENYAAIGEFWDEHDFTDFDDLDRPDVEFEIRDTVHIEADLMSRLKEAANQQGVTLETLVNLWLQERILQ